jgi:hypothetical protein
MKRNRILASVSTVALALGALATFGGNHVDAATKSITPALPYRYKTDTAYFLDKSTSAHYKGVWNSATNAWKKNGFAWKAAANHSKTTLSSYSDNSTSGLNVAGYDKVQYNKATGKIISSEVRLNRAAFKKYGYNTAEQTNVAEHELGHALGLDHNSKGSVSVMNPANRYYSIQGCDVKGMKKIYSTVASFDSVSDNAGDIVTVVNYTPTVKPAVTAVKTSYNAKTKSLTITGKAKGASKLAVSYNAKALKPVKVTKKGQFKTTVKFTGYKDFTLTGLNAKGAAVTKAYVLAKDSYAAAKPTLLKADRTKKGLTFTTDAKKKITLNFYYKNKLVKKAKLTKDKQKVFFSAKSLKGKKGNFKVVASAAGKKSSQAAQFKIIGVGQATVTNY